MLDKIKSGWPDIRDHYDRRLRVHGTLLKLLKSRKHDQFAELALGISDPTANYTANEYQCSHQILAENRNAAARVWALANDLRQVESGHELPAIIRSAGIRFLGIGIGSEISCMVNPYCCWLTNTRSIWTHLARRNNNFAKADEALKLFRQSSRESDMDYSLWMELHSELEPTLTQVAREGDQLARHWNVTPGPATFIWADCIADYLYSTFAGQ